MRYRDVHVGNFFLADKAGGQEFTDEDEEVLVLFASQAATAIANARTHRREQRARADLEALVETTPVGVVVFDARTGRPVSLNREAKRIVGGLRPPDGSIEELLGVVTCRRADGREVSLAEFPLAQQFSNAETVRAEEIPVALNVWAARRGRKPRGRGAPLEHRQDDPPLECPARQPATRRVHALEERRLRLFEVGRLDVGVEGRGRPMMGRDVVPLPALLVQPQPAPGGLPEVVLPAHPEDRAHPREVTLHAGPKWSGRWPARRRGR